MTIGLIILAGGKSSRMGTNKALLPVEGKANIEKILDTLAPSFSHIVLVTNDQDTYSWLNVPMTSDVYPGQGPLAGIHAGLLASLAEVNLVVACDMPFVSTTLGNYLVGISREVDAVVPRWDGQLHPLFAVYRKACAKSIEECIITGNLRLVHFLDRLNVRYVEQDELQKVISSDVVFTNMNNPEEYQMVLDQIVKENKSEKK
ncbi:MAG TPA: molybdenum cofactor guanylyltransferase [Bacillota bacterium]|nr:molybdenum cofactor guanylyltransferase [Bacillota bacterium]